MANYINMTINKQKNIALIAHDGKKQEMLQWCEKNKGILKEHVERVLRTFKDWQITLQTNATNKV